MLRDGDPDSLCAPKTTSKVYSEYNLNVVGMGNQVSFNFEQHVSSLCAVPNINI